MKVFENIGITTQTITENKNGVFLLRSYRINDLKRIYDFLYKNSTIYLERKKEIFDNINEFKEGVNKWEK